MSAAASSIRSPHDDVARRDQLVEQYRFYVLKVARSVADALPVHVEIDDLIGYGNMGLLEAASRYDPSRGARFRTYAHARIRGAMFDGLRRELGPDIAIPFDALEPMTRNAAFRETFVADAGYRASTSGATSAFYRHSCTPATAQEHVVWLSEVRARLERAMETLSPAERAVIVQKYANHASDGAWVRRRYSKSWISRIHVRALEKIRASLLAETPDSEAFR
jgi:RNA polymerase sigma factor for flagellar operon FliA